MAASSGPRLLLVLASLAGPLAACASAPPVAATHWHRLDGKARDPARLEAARRACEPPGSSLSSRSPKATACMARFGYIWLQGV